MPARYRIALQIRLGDLAPFEHRREELNPLAAGSGHDPDIEIVVNITIPAVHVEVSESIASAGKHVWSEKPIGVDREESQRLLALANCGQANRRRA